MAETKDKGKVGGRLAHRKNNRRRCDRRERVIGFIYHARNVSRNDALHFLSFSTNSREYNCTPVLQYLKKLKYFLKYFFLGYTQTTNSRRKNGKQRCTNDKIGGNVQECYFQALTVYTDATSRPYTGMLPQVSYCMQERREKL